MKRAGAKMKLLRKKKIETLADVSEATGIAVSTISEYERGKRIPTVSNMEKLASHYGKTINFIFFT